MNQDKHKYNVHSTRLIKSEDGKLTHVKPAMQTMYAKFVETIKPNQVVDVFFEAHDGSGTEAQLRKIHACIREIAIETGDSFGAVKAVIKQMSGLRFPLKGEKDYEKSFAVCTVRELSLVIQTIIDAGDEVGINFRGALPEFDPAGQP